MQAPDRQLQETVLTKLQAPSQIAIEQKVYLAHCLQPPDKMLDCPHTWQETKKTTKRLQRMVGQ